MTNLLFSVGGNGGKAVCVPAKNFLGIELFYENTDLGLSQIAGFEILRDGKCELGCSQPYGAQLTDQRI